MFNILFYITRNFKQPIIMKKKYVLFLLTLFVLTGFQIKKSNDKIAIIPLPANISVNRGVFKFNKNVTIVSPGDEKAVFAADFFVEKFFGASGVKLNKTENITGKPQVILKYTNVDSLGKEGYIFNSTPGKIEIEANTPAGLFYGVQTLIQLLPPEIYSDSIIKGVDWEVPAVSIVDKPRFGWRGMHLDVSRHFFTKEFIKKYIDLLAMHKMNVFHWHLTDNNGWRLEIKKYPKLTSVSAWRVDRSNESWRNVTPPKPGEKPTYGGYYTQDDVREIVKYAADRNIMVVPEIEMPGHTGEVFAAYPELSCSGKKTFVSPGGWPSEDIFCAGNDSVFTFLEGVLDEVFELFPSPYIHIGGDEADKRTWKKCPKCQQRIKDEHLKNEDELQSWFIKKIEKYIVAHGKKLIGWDEILQGGLAPEATVMSWRGIQGGIEAAKQGHDAIMTPTGYCYFDYYQADPDYEPEAIGGYTTLKKVYSYEPIPEDLTKEEAKHILGAQGNVWTEFMKTPEKVEYMALPRMSALAEVVWTPANKRNWEDFRRRLEVQFKRFDYMGVNYSEGSWRVLIKAKKDSKSGKFKVSFETEQPGYPVYYTLDGSVPDTTSNLYTAPFEVDSTVTVKAGIFKNGKLMRDYVEKVIYFDKAVGKDVSLKNPPSKRYKASGAASLVDGLTGSTDFKDGYWLGFDKADVDVTIDMGKKTVINDVYIGFLHRQSSWIFAPSEIIVRVLNKRKKVIAEKTVVPDFDLKTKKTVIKRIKVGLGGVKGRYINVVAKRNKCPDWHPGKGKTCWVFIDEVAVD